MTSCPSTNDIYLVLRTPVFILCLQYVFSPFGYALCKSTKSGASPVHAGRDKLIVQYSKKRTLCSAHLPKVFLPQD